MQLPYNSVGGPIIFKVETAFIEIIGYECGQEFTDFSTKLL